jgi:hypothetical protein
MDKEIQQMMDMASFSSNMCVRLIVEWAVDRSRFNQDMIAMLKDYVDQSGLPELYFENLKTVFPFGLRAISDDNGTTKEVDNSLMELLGMKIDKSISGMFIGPDYYVDWEIVFNFSGSLKITGQLKKGLIK